MCQGQFNFQYQKRKRLHVTQRMRQFFYCKTAQQMDVSADEKTPSDPLTQLAKDTDSQPVWTGSITKIKSNAIKRVIMGTFLISGFLMLILMGPSVVMLTFLAIQVLCFSEIITIGYKYNQIPNLPHFRSLCWYFVVAANYFFAGEVLRNHFQHVYQKHSYLEMVITYHRFISFCIYFAGIIMFVLSLVRKYDLRQFRILAWTHTLLIIIVLQSYMAIENIFLGLIWSLLPVFLVILNDIFAYLFGRLYGKTPLIKVSPKKTWEGFIGGVAGTLVSGLILSNVMCQFEYFTCPVQYEETKYGIKLNTDCTPDYLFRPYNYKLLPFISFNYYPFTLHFLAFFFFASIIAPFGGFCASGFKRAFKIKDFGDVIPGHGGIMDRFDCQFLMATFVNVYIFTFVRNNSSVDFIFRKIQYMNDKDQVQFFHLLRDSLISDGLIND